MIPVFVPFAHPKLWKMSPTSGTPNLCDATSKPNTSAAFVYTNRHFPSNASKSNASSPTVRSSAPCAAEISSVSSRVAAAPRYVPAHASTNRRFAASRRARASSGIERDAPPLSVDAVASTARAAIVPARRATRAIGPRDVTAFIARSLSRVVSTARSPPRANTARAIISAHARALSFAAVARASTRRDGLCGDSTPLRVDPCDRAAARARRTAPRVGSNTPPTMSPRASRARARRRCRRWSSPSARSGKFRANDDDASSGDRRRGGGVKGTVDAPYGGDDDDFTDRGQDSELNALVQQLESFAEKRTGAGHALRAGGGDRHSTDKWSVKSGESVDGGNDENSLVGYSMMYGSTVDDSASVGNVDDLGPASEFDGFSSSISSFEGASADSTRRDRVDDANT